VFFIRADVYQVRIIVCSLFFALYYFFGQTTGGTLGIRALGLRNVSLNDKSVDIQQALLKTLYYGMATWAILIYLLSLGKYFPEYINNSNVALICCLTNLGLMFLSLVNILFDRQDRSLAEVISKTKTIAKPARDYFSINENKVPCRPEVSNDQEAALCELNKLINKERGKKIQRENSKITDLLGMLIRDKEEFAMLNEAYTFLFGKGIIEDLISIGARRIYYLSPLISIGICE
jgi:hypothetical protein